MRKIELLNKNINQLNVMKDLFVCPVCKKKAIVRNSSIKCTNILCGIVYPIIDNIPILINEEDSVFSIQNYVGETNKIATLKIHFIKKLKWLRKIVPSLSNNLSAKKNFELLSKLLHDRVNPKILIIGGATITTNTEMIFNSKNIIIESDIYFGPRTQIIIDSHHIPFDNEIFDLVIFQAVLEHVADPYKCVKEAHRVLNKEGIVFAATPFMQQVHMGAFDFTRFTHLGHRRLFREFHEIESGVFAGTGVALGWSIKSFVSSLTNNNYLRLFFQVIVTFLFFWLKYVDYLIVNKKGIFDGASGFYFIGRKSEDILSDKELIKLFKGI
ncbi:MAG: methyltransferase domain-containing protein [Melioribacteraceae bacterium]